MKQSVFVVRCFKNRNGAFSWRVQGPLYVVKVRELRSVTIQPNLAAGLAA